MRKENLGMRRLNTLGLAIMMLLVFGAGGWAVTTEITGAVIASGEIAVQSDIKTVQHPSGGIIGELLVSENTPVKAGDVLIRLDGTQAEAELALVQNRLHEFHSRRALAVAERDEEDHLIFPDSLMSQASVPEVSRLLASTQRAFELRRASTLGQVSQINEQISQMRDQIDALAVQKEAKQREIDLGSRELIALRKLLKKNLIATSRVSTLARDLSRMEGELGQLQASAAAAKGRISELEVQILQVGREVRSKAASEVQVLDTSIAEYEERRVAALDQLRRLDIRAPQDGMVHELSVHTVGGVVSEGEALMKIVPTADEYIVLAKVSPTDRDQLAVGQIASLSFMAFNQRATPRIEGSIIKISPSTSVNPLTGTRYYSVRIGLPADEIDRLGTSEISPGMLVTAFIPTEPRTFAQYLLAPLSEQVDRTFRGR